MAGAVYDSTTTFVLEVSSTSLMSESNTMLSRFVDMTNIAMLGLAIIVNLITLARVSCDRRTRHSRANIHAASFFLAEVFFCLNALVAHYKGVFLSETDYDHIISHGHLFIEFMSRSGMVIALGGVVLDRYRVIADVKSYCTRRHLRTSCCFALVGWLVAILLAVPVLAGLTEYWYATFRSLKPFDVYTSVHTVLLYLVPLILFSMAYNALMCRLFTCSNGRSLDSFATEDNKHLQAARRKIATAIIVTVVVFVFSWFLYLAVRIIDGYFLSLDFGTRDMEAMHLAGNLVAYVGMSICPVLVCVVSANYPSLDANRQCMCCSDSQDIITKVEHAWPTTKQNLYYV